MLRPLGKSPIPFSSVLFDGARSALPPIKPGRARAISFMMIPLLSRVASFLPLKSGKFILLKSGFSSELSIFLLSALKFCAF